MAPILVLALTASAQADELAPAKVGYDNGFVIEQGGFKLKTNVRMQFRYELTAAEGVDDREFLQTLAVRRARMKFSGHAFGGEVKYYVQTAFDGGNPGLRDFYVDYVFAPEVMLRVGQAKMPYSRQFIASSGDLLTVDRSFTDKLLPSGRDTGFTLGSDIKAKRVEWMVGLYHGGNEPATGELRPTTVARVGYNHGAIKGYDLVDWDGGGFRFAVAANVHSDLNLTNDAADPATTAGADLIMKVAHFSALIEGHRNLDTDVTSVYALVGQLFGERYQPAVGFAAALDGDAMSTEIVAAFNVFMHQHNMKWTTDVGTTTADDGAVSVTDYRVRSQVQVAF